MPSTHDPVTMRITIPDPPRPRVRVPLIVAGLIGYVAILWLFLAYGRDDDASLLMRMPLAAGVGWCGGYAWSRCRR